MTRFFIFSLIILATFLSLFLFFQYLNITFDELTASLHTQSGGVGIVLSLALLVSDIVLPVPSSIIMIMNGAIYGTIVGSILSLLGGIGATLFGYYIGKSGEKHALKFIGASQLERGRLFFARWGLVALVISRPVPLLSETLAVMAGISGCGPGRTFLSALIGYLPVSVVYAYAGANAIQSDLGATAFLLVMGIAFILWIALYAIQKKQNPEVEN